MGTTCRDIIDVLGGGMQRADKKFKFMIPGGSSVKLLIEQHLDTPYDYEALTKAGSLLGSGGLMVLMRR